MKKSAAIFLGLLAFVTALVSTPAFANQDEATQTKSSELRVDINAADIDTLTKLPGIGEKVAARIIAYRKENGRFQKIEEIMNVRGIGEKTFVKLQKNLTVGKESNKSPSSKKKPELV
jgi:competence protein ComEA